MCCRSFVFIKKNFQVLKVANLQFRHFFVDFVDGTAETGDQNFVLIGDADVVNRGFPGVCHEDAFGRKRVAETDGFGEGNHAVERHGSVAGVVGGKSQRRIRKREGDAAVKGLQAVDHVLFYGHFDETVFFADFNEFYSQPL